MTTLFPIPTTFLLALHPVCWVLDMLRCHAKWRTRALIAVDGTAGGLERLDGDGSQRHGAGCLDSLTLLLLLTRPIRGSWKISGQGFRSLRVLRFTGMTHSVIAHWAAVGHCQRQLAVEQVESVPGRRTVVLPPLPLWGLRAGSS